MEYAPVISFPAACVLLACVFGGFLLWAILLWRKERKNRIHKPKD